MPAPLLTSTALGRRLRAARLAKKLTQTQLGELLLEGSEPGTGATRLSRYETGMHKPDLDTLERLAKLLDLPAAYFVARSETVAKAILVLSQLSAPKQKEALALLRKLAKGKGKK